MVLTAAVIHTGAQLALYGTGIKALDEKGLSGFAITREEIKNNYSQTSSVSKLIIIGEWALLIILIVISLIGERAHIKKQHVVLQLKRTKEKSKTDIDLLYDLLKEKKKIGLGVIADTFKIGEETATEWAKILEDAGLASVHYPRFGETEVRLKE